MQRLSVTVRELRLNEVPLLTEFLYEAVHVPEGELAPPRTIIQEPDVWAYIDGFGSKRDDHAVVAVVDAKAVGAAWARIIGAYGHVDNETPELAVSVYPEFRGQGIGRAMLTSLLSDLSASGYTRASLSVQSTNRAVGLYRSLGFAVVKEHAQELIMVARLHEDRPANTE